jgi:hypothetical protein
LSNTERTPLQQQTGYLALALSQLLLVLVELGGQAGVPAPGALVTAAGAARTYGERLIRPEGSE